MILFVALLMSSCCLGLREAAGVERIERCGTKCSKGLRCRTKPDYFFHPPCESSPEGLSSSSIFRNISLSTVMRCEGRQKCSLHLRIKTALQLPKSVDGLSICTITAGMLSNCQILSFKRASKDPETGLKQVEVENNCVEISAGQHVRVTIKTMPSYCGITWTGTHAAPDCSSNDLQRNVPECITGRLSYDENPQRKELRVSVSDMLEDYNYHLRLCKKDFFICAGTGAYALVKKEEPVKSATFPFSRPLPCLCMEGWSAVTDAPRVQICPFKDRVEELWFGITFDPLEETLSWEPACPVSAVVGLCQEREDGVCVDLPHASQNVSRAKISFTKVDPHPRLCMKFTAGAQSWTRCPFADAGFEAWELRRGDGHQGVEIWSRVTADFSVGVCVNPAETDECKVTETHTVHVEKQEAVGLSLDWKFCSTCLQAKRLDVEFAATVLLCLDDFNESWRLSTVISRRGSEDLTWAVLTVGVCLSGIIMVTLVLHILLTVHLKMKQRRNEGCSSKKQSADSAAIRCVVPAFQTPVLSPDSPDPPSRNTEKAILISD
ncbi:interleukin-17 receptor E-like protein [Halichoeres trimaculatus]|uniref:interleukin-17 receptor E-like protein n=1 Tax=Halichoeres trimaculatus TaxID=147232 RepID=UPI003D9FA527